MARITGGEARGRRLKIYQRGQVRPTSDKVRQAIFNILEHRYELNYSQVIALDLFAGSGSLGIELLSRGGCSVTFVERDHKAAMVLRDNLKLIEQQMLSEGRSSGPVHGDRNASVTSRREYSRLVVQDVDRFLRRPPPEPFGLIFADPPYKDECAPELLTKLNRDWLTSEGVVVIEHAKRDHFTPPSPWILDDRRSYGDTLVSFLSLSR